MVRLEIKILISTRRLQMSMGSEIAKDVLGGVFKKAVGTAIKSVVVPVVTTVVVAGGTAVAGYVAKKVYDHKKNK
jgi:hypothetical protein